MMTDFFKQSIIMQIFEKPETMQECSASLRLAVGIPMIGLLINIIGGPPELVL